MSLAQKENIQNPHKNSKTLQQIDNEYVKLSLSQASSKQPYHQVHNINEHLRQENPPLSQKDQEILYWKNKFQEKEKSYKALEEDYNEIEKDLFNKTEYIKKIELSQKFLNAQIEKKNQYVDKTNLILEEKEKEVQQRTREIKQLQKQINEISKQYQIPIADRNSLKTKKKQSVQSNNNYNDGEIKQPKLKKDYSSYYLQTDNLFEDKNNQDKKNKKLRLKRSSSNVNMIKSQTHHQYMNNKQLPSINIKKQGNIEFEDEESDN